MEKKEHYRNDLPHFQQPGQAYFVTWCLLESVPPKACARYTKRLQELDNQLQMLKQQRASSYVINKILADYRSTRKKYVAAYNRLLDLGTHPTINLVSAENLPIMRQTLSFWNDKRIENIAFCVMPNHVHWVLRTLPVDEAGKPVYLQDLMHSVKKFMATQINQLAGRRGSIWQPENFDTTIRDDVHLYRSVMYTLNNPVKAGWVDDWRQWPGSWACG
ncbi:transposase [Mangrovibacterium marinum]|uniref:transposase n=1 Tax=Mangrovibacterium marinum TaxID=1639118 RepID=UPI002A18CF20|nr:transposase [Mangrovibacterium marinum]